jgi:type II secretory pathway component PulM
MDDMDTRSDVILELARMDQKKEEQWRAFIDAVVSSQIRTWVAISAVC